MDQDRAREEFMSLVEKGESRVYYEDITPQKLMIRFFLPVILGACLGIAALFTAITFGAPMDALLFFVLLLGPTGGGFIVAIFLSLRTVAGASEYSVRGVTRTDLSIAIMFLDMVNVGEADLGRIAESERPAEYDYIRTQGLGIALTTLNKIDPGMGSKWFEVISQRMSQAFSFREKLFLRILFFGTIISVIAGFSLEILRRLGLIDDLLVLYLILGDVIIAVILMIGLIAHIVRNRDAEPPEKVIQALGEPEVRTETDYALTRLFRVVSEEGRYPLRVLVLGSYDYLEDTGRTFTTSRGLTLREAVLFPKAHRDSWFGD
ncbi:MAG: hypothetical protein ACFE7R_09820 [Candidatus Hodarchaeota archaeon]